MRLKKRFLKDETEKKNTKSCRFLWKRHRKHITHTTKQDDQIAKKDSRKLNQRYTIEHKINSFKQENFGSPVAAVGFNL